jgi:hypothetical protein
MLSCFVVYTAFLQPPQPPLQLLLFIAYIYISHNAFSSLLRSHTDSTFTTVMEVPL